MHVLKQLHELMLCGEAAERRLALIPDTAEITDTYPTPPDEVQPAKPSGYKNMRFKICYLKTEESASQMPRMMSTVNLGLIINCHLSVLSVFETHREMSSVSHCIWAGAD